MNNFSHVPPGFRFHPTDEELVDYYLRKKIASKRIDLDVINDIDLYRIEPWDLQELCKLGTDEQNEWYFFSHKDKKYPQELARIELQKPDFGKPRDETRPYIYSKNNLVGMRKTLVFYKGLAPNGQKSDYIMHEYRLETNENGPTQEEGWVVCRVFKKRITSVRRMDEHDSLCWFDHDQVSLMPNFESPRKIITNPYTSNSSYHHHNFPTKSEHDQLHYNHLPQDHSFLQLPQLESPKIQSQQLNMINLLYGKNVEQDLQVSTDWRVLDKFVASQLSNDDQDPSNPPPSSLQMAENMNLLLSDSKSDEIASECASISTSNCQVDLWK